MYLKQPFLRLRSASIVLSLLAMAALPACAQQAGVSVVTSPAVAPNLQLFSSSAANLPYDSMTTELPSLAAHFGPNPKASPQYGGGYGGPGPRRPYGRPTYNDRWTNSDGSSKVAFEAGVGPATAAGATGHYSRTGVDVSVGVGRNFNRAFGVLAQYDYTHLGMPSSTVNNFFGSTGGSGATHLWSLTLNPVITFANSKSQWGMYVVGGAGFYRKMTVFSYQDPVYGGNDCSGVPGCHYSNNAFGVNGGFGFTYKITQDSNAKIFAEARYTWVDNQASVNNSAASCSVSPYGLCFPQTNQRTGYFPVTLGLRF